MIGKGTWFGFKIFSLLGISKSGVSDEPVSPGYCSKYSTILSIDFNVYSNKSDFWIWASQKGQNTYYFPPLMTAV